MSHQQMKHKHTHTHTRQLAEGCLIVQEVFRFINGSTWCTCHDKDLLLEELSQSAESRFHTVKNSKNLPRKPVTFWHCSNSRFMRRERERETRDKKTEPFLLRCLVAPTETKHIIDASVSR